MGQKSTHGITWSSDSKQILGISIDNVAKPVKILPKPIVYLYMIESPDCGHTVHTQEFGLSCLPIQINIKTTLENTYESNVPAGMRQ